MEFFSPAFAAAADSLGAVAVMITIAVLVITDKLVWHTRLRRAEQRADRWEKAALELIPLINAGVSAAETTASIVAALPDPASVSKE